MTDPQLIARVRSAFHSHFHSAPAIIVRAPGRVNLIGEHTDYNEGFVLPMAIDRAVLIALRPRNDDRVRVYSVDFGTWGEFSLQALSRDQGWLEYLKGMAWALQEAGYSLRGFEGVVAGDVPRGSGLSSSAALELAVARAFCAVSGLTWDPVAMARLGQRCENGWVGANTGIMDQLISATGRAGYAMLIDCRTLELTPVPLPAGTAVVVMDTMTRHQHTDSGYNTRRDQCEQAARHLGVRALRDVMPAQLEAAPAGLSGVLLRRARHVVSENQRTLEAAEALRAGDAARLGALMNASHESLRYDFEVTNDALNTMVALARAQAGCLGARMTGGGFGGCAVALIERAAAERFCAAVAAGYRQATGLAPELYLCAPAEGASLL